MIETAKENQSIQAILDADISTELKEIAGKVAQRKRITNQEAIYLYHHAELSYLGILANHIRTYMNKNYVYFNHNFHV